MTISVTSQGTVTVGESLAQRAARAARAAVRQRSLQAEEAGHQFHGNQYEDASTPGFIDSKKVFAGSRQFLGKGAAVGRVTVPIKSLYSTQDYTGLDKANAIAKDWRADKVKTPQVVKDKDGNYRIFDGHHTLAAMKIRGDENATVDVFQPGKSMESRASRSRHGDLALAAEEAGHEFHGNQWIHPNVIYHTFDSKESKGYKNGQDVKKGGLFGLAPESFDVGGKKFDPFEPNEYGDKVLALHLNQIPKDKIFTAGTQMDAVEQLFGKKEAEKLDVNLEKDLMRGYADADKKILTELNRRGYWLVHYNQSEQYGDEYAVINKQAIHHVEDRNGIKACYGKYIRSQLASLFDKNNLALSAEEAGHQFHGNQWTSGNYTPRREPEYYGKAAGGLSQEAHQFLTDWQDSPSATPSDSVITELKKYRPTESLQLWRGGTVGAKGGLKSFSYNKETAEGFQQAGEGGEKVYRRRVYPDEVLVDYTKLPQAYKDDLEKNGMGNSLKEVVVGYGATLKHMKAVRGELQLRRAVEDLALSASTASEVKAIVDSLEQDGKLPPNLPVALKQKMQESLTKYFGQISADKVQQFADKAAEVVEDTLKTFDEVREDSTIAETGLNPATARTSLTGFIEDMVGGSVGDVLNMDFFLQVARQVVQGGMGYVAQNWDDERVQEFPALELTRLYSRYVPRGDELVKGVPQVENGWDYRWLAACDEAGDDDALNVFNETGRMVALKSSGVWQALGDGAGGYEDTLGNPFEPFAFNSGYGTNEVTRAEAVALGLMDDLDEDGDKTVAEGADVDFDTLFDLPEDLEARAAAAVAALEAEEAGHQFHGNQWVDMTNKQDATEHPAVQAHMDSMENGEPSSASKEIGNVATRGDIEKTFKLTNGKVVGAAGYSLSKVGKNISIHHMGSLENGAGTAMLKHIAQMHPGRNIVAKDVIADAEGFYKKLGFRKANSSLYGDNDWVLSRTQLSSRLQAAEAGHPFYGNQWMHGNGGTALKRSGEGKDSKWVTEGGGELPEHIKNLAIPPAWKNVRVAPGPELDLQVIAEDTKGRVQRVYSDAFVQRQADAKFSRTSELIGKQEKIFKQNEDNLRSTDPKLRENAACMKLIQQTGIRPGSENDTGAEKQAYGATTLQGRHVTQDDDGTVRMKFVGKKGVSLDIPVEDKATAKMLLERSAAAGPHGKLFDTDDASLRNYSHTLNGGSFKPKDFRTLKGTQTAIAEVEKTPAPKTLKDYKKAVLDVAKKVAAKLGNTPAISLQSYIMPSVFSQWKAGVA